MVPHKKKKNRKKMVSFLVLLILILFVINYSYLNEKVQKFFQNYEEAFVSRIIDGDTLETSSGEKIRLLGINTPEKGEKYSENATKFLRENVLNRTIELEFSGDKYDRYGRTLAYIYLDRKNINAEIVRNGFANYYFPSGKDTHYNELMLSWKECIEKNLNLCKKSENVCASCIELRKFDYNKEEIIFYNKCDFQCNLNGWSIKDEGRKKFIFENFSLESGEEVKIIVGEGNNSGNTLFWREETYVWTRTGDTLFLRDNQGDLVFWEGY